MTATHEPYLKAASTDRMAPYYDAMARLGMREGHIKGRVIELAEPAPGRRLLDVGSGTGTLVLMARRRFPGATIIGIDGDPTILGIARSKAKKAGITAQFDEGMAYTLPYSDASFDAVVSTLTFHHLTPDQQERTLSEIRRVLRPGGRLVIADVTLPHNRRMRLVQNLWMRFWRRHRHHGANNAHGEHRVERHAAPLAHAEGHAHPSPHAPGQPRRMTLLEQLLLTTGWTSSMPVEHYMSMMGTIALYAVTRPD